MLLAGLSNQINFIVDETERRIVHKLPFDPTENEEYRRFMEKTDSGLQFSHTLEEQLGGQLKAGLRLTDILEDTNGSGYLHEMNIKTYMATRAVKD